MMPGAKQLKVSFRRYGSRQKQKLIHRVINPARYFVDLARVRLRGSRTISNAPTLPIRVALISDRDAYCSEEQFYPFAAYRLELRKKLRLISVHLLLKDVLHAPELILSRFDIIVLKMSYRTTPSEALRVVQTIRNAVSSKSLVYFDGDDDLCIQWPEILPYVDLYTKKHVFRDRCNYSKRFVGKSNLHDYVHHKFGHTFSALDYGDPGDKYTMISESGPVPIDQLAKISLGYNLALDRNIINLYENLQRQLLPRIKESDIIFRGSVKSAVWSYHLRKGIEPILRRLQKPYRVIIPTGRVPLEEYHREMMSSKICISPFGFGEI
jgi:hypothetical protein